MTRWFSDGGWSLPSTTTGLLSELRDFRNSFEHASRDASVPAKHSKLGASPAGANISDAMEAMAICVHVCDCVRFVLPGCDLMPEVVPPSRKHRLWVPLDEFAAGVAFPSFQAILDALNLNTDVTPYPAAPRLPGQALTFGALVIKARPDAADLMASQDVDLWPLFESFVARQSPLPDEDQFGLPRYVVGH